ncbi:MAG: glycoside hydrolase family 95 protein [Cytophagales bacterium]|nr:glycoside hydrolase family 95 protein [Cytophagales bacterium]
MHHKLLIPLLLILSLGACKEKAGFSEKLWYNQPAKDWFEALPLGNGRLGAMVFGRTDKEQLQLNEESLWAGRPEDPYPEDIEMHYPEFQRLNLEGKFEEAYEYARKHLVAYPTSFRSYQPFGDLFLKFDHKTVENYTRALDLATAINLVAYDFEGKRFMRETFIPEEYDVLVYRFESQDRVPTDCEISFHREKDVTVKNQDDELWIDGQIFDNPDGYDDNAGGSGKGGMHMKFAGMVKVLPDDGTCTRTDSSLVINGSSSFTVLFGATTNYDVKKLDFGDHIDYREILKQQIARASKAGYGTMKQAHVETSTSRYNRLKLDISGVEKDTIPTDRRLERLKEGAGDPYLAQLLFQYGRYLLLSSSGGKAVLPANLQGIWNKDMWAAWESDFHLNINLQMNYWPADVCNISETVVPLSNFMRQLADRGKITASKFINSGGWVAHHVTNPFGRTTPSGSNENSQITNGYSFPLAGAWMAMTLWRHYEFTRDEKYLSEVAYPVLKGAARFILDFLREDKTGYLVTAPSYSPENTYIHPESGKRLRNTVAASIDIQIIRDVFQACLEAEKIISDGGLSEEIENAMAKLPPVKIGRDGTIREWMEDYEEAEPGHRHISHLYALHPSNQINPGTPRLFEAAKKTLERRLSFGGGQTGWSRAWMVNFYARLLDGNQCLYHVNQLMQKQITPNLFDLHPPHIFQIDGNLGVTAGIAEMLIQSHEPGVIRLLPALPDDWGRGSVAGLKARGNYEVSMQWEDGNLIQTDVKAIKGGKTQITYREKAMDLELRAGERKTIRFDGGISKSK